jgi:DNA-binding transcriptional ArsR family regulator
MFEIIVGSLEERIIRILQKTYPITVENITKRLSVSAPRVMRTLNKLQVQGIVRLEPLPDTIFIKLVRQDFHFIGKTKKTIKQQQKKLNQTKDDSTNMYQ